MTLVRLLALTLTTATADSTGDALDLADLFLLQVAAQTFNSSGVVKHVQDARNQSHLTATKTLLSNGTVLRLQGKQPRNTRKDSDGSQIVQDQLGLKANSAADSEALRASFFFNVGLISAYMAGFVILQRWKPLVYLHNTMTQRAPEPHPSWFGIWLEAEEVEEYAGLDSALMIEFCNLGMKVCAYLGLPLCAVCLPVYYVMGKHPGLLSALQPELVCCVPSSTVA